MLKATGNSRNNVTRTMAGIMKARAVQKRFRPRLRSAAIMASMGGAPAGRVMSAPLPLSALRFHGIGSLLPVIAFSSREPDPPHSKMLQPCRAGRILELAAPPCIEPTSACRPVRAGDRVDVLH